MAWSSSDLECIIAHSSEMSRFIRFPIGVANSCSASICWVDTVGIVNEELDVDAFVIVEIAELSEVFISVAANSTLSLVLLRAALVGLVSGFCSGIKYFNPFVPGRFFSEPCRFFPRFSLGFRFGNSLLLVLVLVFAFLVFGISLSWLSVVFGRCSVFSEFF